MNNNKKIIHILITILFIIFIIIKLIPRIPRDIFHEITPFLSMVYWLLFLTNGFFLSLNIIKKFKKEKETVPLIINFLEQIKNQYMKISRDFYESFANDPYWALFLVKISKKYATMSNRKIVLIILLLRIIIISALIYDVFVLQQFNLTYKTFCVLLIIIFNKIGIRITREVNIDMLNSIKPDEYIGHANYIRFKYKMIEEKLDELVNLLSFSSIIQISIRLIYTIVWGYIVFYYPLNIVSIIVQFVYIFAIKNLLINYKFIIALTLLLLYIKK